MDLIDRRARDENEVGVASLGEVRVDAFEVVGEERAVRTSNVGLRTEHEVVNDELVFAVEQIGEGGFAGGAGEGVWFGHLDAGKGFTLGSNLGLELHELLLLGEEGETGFKPLIRGNDLWEGSHVLVEVEVVLEAEEKYVRGYVETVKAQERNLR